MTTLTGDCRVVHLSMVLSVRADCALIVTCSRLMALQRMGIVENYEVPKLSEPTSTCLTNMYRSADRRTSASIL